MKKKNLKSMIFFALPVVVFLTLAVFLVSGISSGYVSAVSGNGGGILVDFSSKFEININKTRRVDDDGNFDPNGDWVYFGSYPKTYQPDTSVITTTQDENGYYLGTDGEKYAKVSANPHSPSCAFNDGTTIVEGTEYYFKVEPIKWRILKTENGKALLLCEDIIDAHAFNVEGRNLTLNETTIYENNYKYSDIRAWLNGYGQEEGNTKGEDWSTGGFLQTAFTTEEQDFILTTEVDNSVSTAVNSSKEYICENTNDKVFLMSCKEMRNKDYGFISSFSTQNTERRKQTTDYARANSVWYYTEDDSLYNGNYWLRSPGSSYRAVYRVDCFGKIEYIASVRNSYGVVPALYITELILYDFTISGNTATTGGGVYNKGDFIMNGGIIKENFAESGKGNDVYNSGTFTMNGGEIGVERYEKIARYDENDQISSDGKYVYFGSFPKSLKESFVSIVSSEPDSDGYYLGSDGNKYVSLVASSTIEDVCFTNGEKVVVGEEYFFKVEPVKWKILSEEHGKAIIVTDDIVDTWWFDREYHYYGSSSIRSWLKTSFYNTCFSETDKKQIIKTDIDGYSDNVWLLSYDDLLNTDYGFSGSENETTTRMKKNTDYSIAHGNDDLGFYWTRTMENSQTYYVYGCGPYGKMGTHSSSVYGGVVPALTIDLKVEKIEEKESVYNDGTMNLNGGKINNSIYSSGKINISNCDVDATIFLLGKATIEVCEGFNFRLKIDLTNYSGSIFLTNKTGKELDVEFIYDQENYRIIKIENNSNDIEYKMIKCNVEFPTDWKDETFKNSSYKLSDFKILRTEEHKPTNAVLIKTFTDGENGGIFVYTYEELYDGKKYNVLSFCNPYGKILAPQSCKNLFANTDFIEMFFENFDTSNTTNFNGMFQNNPNLKTLDLRSFVISSESNVEDMLDLKSTGSNKINKIITPESVSREIEIKTDSKLSYNGSYVEKIKKGTSKITLLAGDSLLTSTGGYIYYGFYPQSLKKDDVKIMENSSRTIGSMTVLLGSDGAYYVKQTMISENGYWGASVGKVLYFKVEPILWRVIKQETVTGGTYFTLLANNILNAQQYREMVKVGSSYQSLSLPFYFLGSDFSNFAFSPFFNGVTYTREYIYDNSINVSTSVWCLDYEDLTSDLLFSSSHEAWWTREKTPTDFTLAVCPSDKSDVNFWWSTEVAPEDNEFGVDYYVWGAGPHGQVGMHSDSVVAGVVPVVKIWIADSTNSVSLVVDENKQERKESSMNEIVKTANVGKEMEFKEIELFFDENKKRQQLAILNDKRKILKDENEEQIDD